MRSRWLRPVVAAPGSWDPDLHPRARDGKFIEVLGFINALVDGKWTRAQVTSIVPDKASPKNPDIFIDIVDSAGKRVKSTKVKSANVSTAAKAKALLHKAEFTPRTWATTWKNAAELDEHIAGLDPADRLKEFEHNAGVPRSPSLPSRLKKMSDPDLKATFEAIDDATDKDIAREVKIEMSRRGLAGEVVKPSLPADSVKVSAFQRGEAQWLLSNASDSLAEDPTDRTIVVWGEVDGDTLKIIDKDAAIEDVQRHADHTLDEGIDAAGEQMTAMARYKSLTQLVDKIKALDVPQPSAPEPEKLPEVAPVSHVWDSGATFIFQTAGIDPNNPEAKTFLKRVKSAALTLDSGATDFSDDVGAVRKMFMQRRLKELGLSKSEIKDSTEWLDREVANWTAIGGMPIHEEQLYPIANKLFKGEPLTAPNELAVQAMYEYNQAILKLKNPSGTSRVVRVIGGWQGTMVETAARNKVPLEFGTRPLSSWSVEKGLPSLRAWLGGRRQAWQEVPNEQVLIAFWGDERFRTVDLKAKGEYVIWHDGPIEPEIVIDSSREDHYSDSQWGMDDQTIAAMRAAGREDELTGEWLDKYYGLRATMNDGGKRFAASEMFRKAQEAIGGDKYTGVEYGSALLPAVDKWIAAGGFGHFDIENWQDDRNRALWAIESLAGADTTYGYPRPSIDWTIAFMRGAIERGVYVPENVATNWLLRPEDLGSMYLPGDRTSPEALQFVEDYSTPGSTAVWDLFPKATPEQITEMQGKLDWQQRRRKEELSRIRRLAESEAAGGPESKVKKSKKARTIAQQESARGWWGAPPWLQEEIERLGERTDLLAVYDEAYNAASAAAPIGAPA